MGHVDVHDPSVLEERIGSGHRVVDDLVGDDDGARLEPGRDPADRGHREYPPDPGVTERPHVGPVVDPVGRDGVVRTVAGQKYHASPCHLTEHERRGGLSESGDRAPFTRDDEARIRLEAGATDDRVGRHQPASPSPLRPTQSRANW